MPSERIIEVHCPAAGNHEYMRYVISDEKVGDDIRHALHSCSICHKRDNQRPRVISSSRSCGIVL